MNYETGSLRTALGEPVPFLVLAEELCGIDGEGAASWDPGGDEPDDNHGGYGAEEHEWVARGCFVDDGGQQTAGQDSEKKAG